MKPEETQSTTGIRWLLASVTTLVYIQVARHDFVNYDDSLFVVENPHVYTGLSLPNLKWAFTTLNGGATSYQPLVWLSHQLDCQVFGLTSGSHHLTSLWLHVANTLLLFTLLDWLTGRPQRSAVVAGLFALHPLHVETVAWVSERKTLVCTLFWFLSTLAYVRYTRKRSVWGYVSVLVLYVAALLSKPIAVSLPFTLLLLDWWPLCRVRMPPVSESGTAGPPEPSAKANLACLALEKVPLVLLTAIFCWITLAAQSDLGATKSLQDVPMKVRLNNSLIAPVLYLRKTVWPSDLAPIYPLRSDWAGWQAVICGVLLLGMTGWTLRQAVKRPYLLTGWFWYLVTLLPTLGLVQVGSQGMADRYSYVPLIGIFCAVVWDLSERLASLRFGIAVPRLTGRAVLLACAICTFFTAQNWRNSLALFGHAVEVTDRNFIALRQLGMAEKNAGNLIDAERRYRESVEVEPKNALTHALLGHFLFIKGDCRAALEQYTTALELKPSELGAHRGLAELFLQARDPQLVDPAKALDHALKVCELSRFQRREFVAELARAFLANGRIQDARGATRRTLELSVSPAEIEEAKQLLSSIQTTEKPIVRAAAGTL